MTRERITCESCGSDKLDIREDTADSADYDKYSDTTSYQTRGICKECGYDNFIEENFKVLKDGTMVYTK